MDMRILELLWKCMKKSDDTTVLRRNKALACNREVGDSKHARILGGCAHGKVGVGNASSLIAVQVVKMLYSARNSKAG